MRPGIVSGLFLCKFLGWAWRGGLTRLADLDERRGICEWRPDLCAAVEDFFNFWRCCSTLGGARGGFRCGSRQNSVGKSVFCLLCGPQRMDLGAGVDKN